MRRFGEPVMAYRADVPLMTRLGLRTTGFGNDWTHVGTVEVLPAKAATPDDPHNPFRPATTVKVEVSAHPAQFWRFTITRPQDRCEDLPDGEFRVVHEPVEVIEVRTGSGPFGDYWPMADAIAKHLLTVTTKGEDDGIADDS
jgi:hypothetical protein